MSTIERDLDLTAATFADIRDRVAGARSPGPDLDVELRHPHLSEPTTWQRYRDDRLVDWVDSARPADLVVEYGPTLTEALFGIGLGEDGQPGAADAIRVGLPGTTLDRLPPLHRSLGGLDRIPGATVDVQYRFTDSPVATVPVFERYVDGQLTDTSVGELNDAHVTLTVKYVAMLAYRAGEIDLYQLIAEERPEGPLRYLNLLAGLCSQPPFRTVADDDERRLYAAVSAYTHHITSGEHRVRVGRLAARLLDGSTAEEPPTGHDRKDHR